MSDKRIVTLLYTALIGAVHVPFHAQAQSAAPAIDVRSIDPIGEADVVFDCLSNATLTYFWATPGSLWQSANISVVGDGVSPAIAVRTTDPTGEADIVWKGPNNTLKYAFATPG